MNYFRNINNINIDILQESSDIVFDNQEFDNQEFDNQEFDNQESDTETFDESNDDNIIDNELEIEQESYGCKHYKRRCKIVAPCCNKIFSCRLCHDYVMYEHAEAIAYEIIENKEIKEINDKDSKSNLLPHKINRFNINKIVCDECNLVQDVKKFCENCGICFGSYFCQKCKLFDDVDKKQFHCDKGGICRVGFENSEPFHCDSCNTCINKEIKDNHKCFNIKETACPVCFDNLFETTKNYILLKCGHSIHNDCF